MAGMCDGGPSSQSQPKFGKGIWSMAIPNFQVLMSPLLRLAEDGEEHHIRSAIEALERDYRLSPHERAMMVRRGSGSVFSNRVAWAKKHLCEAGLLTVTRRGYFQITAGGRKILLNYPANIDRKFLTRFRAYRDYLARAKTSAIKRPKAPVRGVRRQSANRTSLSL